jgi:2-methylisocitrate lyase-like PEP mutase family enzyme
MALRSARLASDALLSGRAASAFQARLAAEVGFRVRWSTRLSWAVMSGPGQDLAALICHAFPGWLPGLARATRMPAPPGAPEPVSRAAR